MHTVYARALHTSPPALADPHGQRSNVDSALLLVSSLLPTVLGSTCMSESAGESVS